MIALLAALVQAPPPPLVGDTVWIERQVRAPAGSLLRPLPWQPGAMATLLGAPVIEVRTDGWLMRYPVVFWEVGRHRLQVPGPLVIREDGRTDSLPAQAVEIEVGSLVPRGQTVADTVAPKPAADLLPVAERSLQPAVLLGLLAALVLAPLHWWWRRRGRPVPGGSTPASGLSLPPDVYAKWSAMGEWRLVADGWIARLEAQSQGPERERLLRDLRSARYGSGDPDTIERLCREAAAL
ncbi:MAG: hypothetical protein SGI84_04580 [Gemmatimonadota bacterium]|nr:hypothetical protein [Gemmatimonadota bacterium]